MTDANQALLIGMAATFVTGVIIPVVTHILKARELARLSGKIIDVERAVVATQDDVHKVELATNSMKDQLVAATKVASHAEGMKQEQVEQTAREAQQATGAAAQVRRQADIDKIPPGSLGP